MHLTALVENPEHVCCRYRLAAFRPWLAKSGHTLDLRTLPRRWWSWARLPRTLRNADAVVLQRVLLNRWQRYLLRQAARLLVFDFDDAVFLRDSYSAKGLYSGKRQRRFTALVRDADVVVAGNSFLAGQAVPARAGRPVRVIPTVVDPARYPLAEHVRSGEGVELVWVGSSSTLQGLKAIRPILEGLGQAWPGLRLKLICDQFLLLRHLQVQACPWSASSEGRDIAAADIGISWVPDDLWSRGKCGLKVLQYMAAGLPVVANPVGVQAELVRHGETGFLVQTPTEWADAITKLGANPVLRRSMGQAGRLRVEKDLGVQTGAAAWIRLLHEVQPRSQVA